MSRIRPFVPAILWMGIIFVMSSSLFGSDETGTLVQDVIRYFYPSATPEDIETINFVVRKAAHFTEYAVLAVLWHRGLAGGSGLDTRDRVVTAFVISAVYAASDEFHQSFVPGRTPAVADVLLDSSGAAFACLLLWLGHKKARPSGRAL